MTVSKTKANKLARRLMTSVTPVAASKFGTTYGYYMQMDPEEYGKHCTSTVELGSDYHAAVQRRRDDFEELVEAIMTGERYGLPVPSWYYEV